MDSRIAPEYQDTWFFPRLAGGEEQGLNDPGVESFKSESSLGRETIQNVQDARSPEAIRQGLPAVVEFELLQMPTSEMPGRKLLSEIFVACRKNVQEHSKESDQTNNGLDFLDRGIDLLGGPTVPVLRIRDRNTTGLVGTGGPEDKRSPWWRLIRGQGFSSAEGVGGGTYGIGQRAPFAFSNLRTVLYSTRLGNGEEAFIAKSILCSFRHPNGGYLTQSRGWFCRLSGTEHEPKWNGIRDPGAIPDYFRRNEPGTDLYVAGYNESPEWKAELRRSVLRNFFAAIWMGSLEVQIKDGADTEKLDSESIQSAVEREAKEAPKSSRMRRTHFFLRALTEPMEGGPRKTTLENLGEVKLYIYLEKSAPNRVAYMRKPLILVEDKSHSTLSGYAGVFVCDSKNGNDFLAAMESPTHDRWDHAQARNWSNAEKKRGKQTVTALRRWVREQLMDVGTQGQQDAQDVIDLADYLPAEDEGDATRAGGGAEVTGEGQEQPETGHATPRPTARRRVDQLKSQVGSVAKLVGDDDGTERPTKGERAGGHGEDAQPAAAPSSEGEQRQNAEGGATPGPGPGNGPGSEEGSAAGSGGGGNGEGGRGSGSEQPGAQRQTPSGKKQKRIALEDVSFRSFALTPQEYRIVLKARRTCRGSLRLRAIGEMGQEDLKIEAVESKSSLSVFEGSIDGISLRKGQRIELTVRVDSAVKLAIGVQK